MMDDRRRARLAWVFRVGVVLLLGHAAFGLVEFLVNWLRPSIGMSDGWRLGVISVEVVTDSIGYLLLVRPLFAMADLWEKSLLRFAAGLSLALGLWWVFIGSVWLIDGVSGGAVQTRTVPHVVDMLLEKVEDAAHLAFMAALSLALFALARRARAMIALRSSAVILALWCCYLATLLAWDVWRLVDRAAPPSWTPWFVWIVWFGIGVSALMWIPCVLLWLRAPRLFRRPDEEGLCPVCFYDLGGQSRAGCPECGWKRTEARSA